MPNVWNSKDISEGSLVGTTVSIGDVIGETRLTASGAQGNLRVDVYGPTSCTLEGSMDGGTTWIALSATSSAITGGCTIVPTTADLPLRNQLRVKSGSASTLNSVYVVQED